MPFDYIALFIVTEKTGKVMKRDEAPARGIFRLALPVTAGMISHTVLNIVDTAMVGRLGDVALAAVGLGSFFLLVSVLVFGSLSVGTQAVTSRRLGEGRFGEFPRILYSSASLALIVGAIASVAGYFLSPSIFSALSSDPEVIEAGTPYLAVRFIGLFAMVTIFTLRGFVFGMARVRIDMVVSIFVNVLNIALNWLLIFGKLGFPRLETVGAAVASTVSTVTGLILYMILVRLLVLRKSTGREGSGKIDRGVMASIVKISAPRAVQSMSVVGFLVFLTIVGRLGVEQLAISNIIFKAFNLSFMVGMSIGAAAATLVGKSLGRGRGDLAERYGWKAAAIGALLMGLIGALFMFFPRWIMGRFTSSPGTIERGVAPFRFLGAFQVIDGVGIVLSRTLQGAGSTLFVMVSETVCVWLFMIPVAWAAVELLGGGILAAWWGMFLYIVVFASMMSWKFREGGWKNIKI